MKLTTILAVQIVAVATAVLFLNWLTADPIPGPPATFNLSALSPQEQAAWHKAVDTPILSPNEWQASCGTTGRIGPNEVWSNRCTIQVVVECPPDCGVYKILREDKLLRRIW